MVTRVLVAMFVTLALAAVSKAQAPIPEYEQPFLQNGKIAVPAGTIPGFSYSPEERDVAIRDLQKLQDGPLHTVSGAMKVLHHNLPLGLAHVVVLNHALMLDPDPIAQAFLTRLRKAALEAVK